MTFEEKCSLIDMTRMQEFSARANELNALEKVYGETVAEVVLAARAVQVKGEWRSIAGSVPRNDIQGIIDTLWKWVADVGFKFTISRTEKAAQVTVTYCPIAEMAKKIGETQWGYRCYCCDDFSIVKGFNPDIIFERTKTLMEGHDCCNHTYTERDIT